MLLAGLIVLGLATPAADAAAVGTMIPAAAVLAPGGFFAARGGFEYPAPLGVSTAALALTGSGDWRRTHASVTASTGPGRRPQHCLPPPRSPRRPRV